MKEQEETKIIAANFALHLEIPIEILQEAQLELRKPDLSDESFKESYVKILTVTAYLQDLMRPGLEQVSLATPEKSPSEAGEEAVANAFEFGKGIFQGLARVLDGTTEQKPNKK